MPNPIKPLNRWLCVIALFMASLNLRPVVSSIAPVLGSIQHDLGLNGCCIQLTRFVERVITLSLMLIGGSTLVHLFIHSAIWLLFTTVLSGMGIAMMGPLLSGFIKKHLADRAPSMIAIYSMALALEAALGSSLTSPLYRRLHSWQMSLSFWAEFYRFICQIVRTTLA